MRYSLVGLVINIAIYFIYLLLTYLSVSPKKAMTLVYIVGAFIGFVGNQQWTFANSSAFSNPTLRFVLAHIFGYFLNLLIFDFIFYYFRFIYFCILIMIGISSKNDNNGDNNCYYEY
jgi:putative flippase GtrA